MRLIDADALILAMEEFRKALGEDMTHGIFYANIAPTIDAVPVIRCKDCKFAKMTIGGDEAKYCRKIIEELEYTDSVYLDKDFFCAWAERKEE